MKFVLSRIEEKRFRLSRVEINEPSTPLGLTATFISLTQVRLLWTNVSTDEIGTIIERSVNGVNYTEIHTAGNGVEMYVDDDVLDDVVYYYRIRAYKAFEKYSDYSNVANAGYWSSWVHQVVSDYSDRVTADGGTLKTDELEGTNYLKDQLALIGEDYFDEASLVMIPSAVKTGILYSVKGDDFTFTRNLAKWVIGKDDILYSTPSNTPALRWDNDLSKWEYDKENSATQLAGFPTNHDYLVAQGIGVTRYSNTDDSPFGAGIADRITETATFGSHFIYGGWVRTAGNRYYVSFILKPILRTKATFSITASGGGVIVVDFSAVTATLVSGSIDYGIEAFGDGYFRIWIGFTAETSGVGGESSTIINLYTTSSSYTGDVNAHLIRCHHQLELNAITSPILTDTPSTRPEDIASVTSVINTSNPYSFIYDLSGRTYAEIYKDGNKTTYIDGVNYGTVAQAASANVTLSTVGRYGRFLIFPRELTEEEVLFFFNDSVTIDTEVFSIDNTNITIDRE